MKIKYRIRNIYIWACKCFDYMKFLWDDHDFDYEFLLRLLSYKIERMKNCMYEDRIIDEMLYAQKLIREILSDNFEKEIKKELDRKWGEVQIVEFERDDGDIATMAIRKNAVTEEQKKECRNDYFNSYRFAMEKKSQHIEDLFRHISDKIEGWWS